MTSHIDHAVITLLTQDEPGLEVLSVEGDWIDVPMAPEALFVFVGDYAQRWTNGAGAPIGTRMDGVDIVVTTGVAGP
jgi:isopenicillin N synthase-like dioxygenase